ncbi:hypothetical protein DFH09DRAFT_1134263, partial [Mycena vulgaris]
ILKTIDSFHFRAKFTPEEPSSKLQVNFVFGVVLPGQGSASRTLRSTRSTRAPHPATSGASYSADCISATSFSSLPIPTRLSPTPFLHPPAPHPGVKWMRAAGAIDWNCSARLDAPESDSAPNAVACAQSAGITFEAATGAEVTPELYCVCGLIRGRGHYVPTALRYAGPYHRPYGGSVIGMQV